VNGSRSAWPMTNLACGATVCRCASMAEIGFQADYLPGQRRQGGGRQACAAPYVQGPIGLPVQAG
jgi:hypothetical protein